MTIAVLCRLCGRHIMNVRPQDLTSNHCDAVCSACEAHQLEILNYVRKITDDSIEKIKRVEAKFVEDITRLSSVGIASVNSQTLEELRNRQGDDTDG